MKWTGLTEHTTVNDPGLQVAQSIVFDTENEVRRRPGLSLRTTVGGRGIADYRDSIAGPKVIAVDASGNLESATLGSTGTTLESGLSTDNIPSFARANGSVYIANDFDPMRVVTPAGAAYQAGITGPTAAIGAGTAASGGAMDAGDHLFRYRYYNSKTLAYSNPSPATTVTVTANQKVTFTIGTSGTDIIRSTDPKVDQIIVEATLVDGTAYYFAATVNQTESSVEVTLADATLSQQQVVAGDADGFGHEPPPLMGIVAEHRGRVFGFGSSTVSRTVGVTNASATVTGTGFSTSWSGRLFRVTGDTVAYRIVTATTTTLTLSEVYAGSTNASAAAVVYSGTPDLLYWSVAGRAESWRPSRNARRVMQTELDVPTGLASYYGDLLIFGLRSTRRLVFVTEPGSAELVISDKVLGVYNQRCLVWADGTLYGFGPAGIWAMDGTSPRLISQPVKTTLRTIDQSQSAKFHTVFSPDDRTLLFFAVESGDTEPRLALTLHRDSGQWGTWRYDRGIVGSMQFNDGTGQMRVVLADEHGESWAVAQDTFDGVSTSTVVTTGSGSSGTTITLSATAPAHIGAYLYDPVQDESRRITNNSGADLTIASAFTADPPAGRELWIGRIPVRVRPKWTNFQNEVDKGRPYAVDLSYVPDAAGPLVTVRTYIDNGTTPETHAILDATYDLAPTGCVIRADETGWDVTLSGADGFVQVPLTGDFVRSRTFEISSSKPVGALRLISAMFAVTRSDADQVEGE